MSSGERALDIPSILGTVTRPLAPLFRRARVRRAGTRRHHPEDIHVPAGYAVDVVATGLDAPVHVSFGPDGAAYVTESGHKTLTVPRVVRIDPATGEHRVVVEIPAERRHLAGAATGTCWVGDELYLMNTDTLSRVRDGRLEDVVTGLPGLGDHQANHPVAGPDGRIWFAVGTATNAGVVGPDNAAFEWLPDHPGVHDVPARDVILVGEDFESPDVLGDVRSRARTGAFRPFGTTTGPREVVPGDVKANGAVLRCDPDGSNLEVVAWGLRNPYGLAFHPDGRPFVTEHGMDERGARFVVGDPDDLYEIVEGGWYGWPDFASGIRLDDPRWGRGGQGRNPVMLEHPTDHPPVPVATFAPHAAANGLAISGEPRFGFEGHAFVALFGDMAPVTTPRLATPQGFKVVRVDLETGLVHDFAVNEVAGPASKLWHDGFERPSHVAFGPDGALYVADFGEIDIAPEQGAVRVRNGTGTLWRIRRRNGIGGLLPEPSVELPLYALQAIALLVPLALVSVAVFGFLAHRIRR